MQHRLTELRRRRRTGEGGFTLIELLVVVVIIGILIAIAIPVYLNYEKGARDKSAASDVRNAVPTLELCNANYGRFPKDVPLLGGPLDDTGCPGQRINLSAGTRVLYYLTSDQPQSYVLLGTNTGGSGKVYCYNSAVGGSIVAMPGGNRSIDWSSIDPAAMQSVHIKDPSKVCQTDVKLELPKPKNTRG